MDRKTGNTFNRKALLACKSAVCVYCEKTMATTEINDWIDLNDMNIGQTALCPFCQSDGIIGFNGNFDPIWLHNFRKHHQLQHSGGAGR